MENARKISIKKSPWEKFRDKNFREKNEIFMKKIKENLMRISKNVIRIFVKNLMKIFVKNFDEIFF